MRCPSCAQPLVEQAEGLYGDIPVYACSPCGAAFYPPGSLDRLDDSVVVNAEELRYESIAEEKQPGACPRCVTSGYRETAGVELRVHRLQGPHRLEVAICPSCRGFWLERGMLERLRELVLRISSAENAELNEQARLELAKQKKQQ